MGESEEGEEKGAEEKEMQWNIDVETMGKSYTIIRRWLWRCRKRHR